MIDESPNQAVKQTGRPVTPLARSCGESDTGSGFARVAPVLAAAHPRRLSELRHNEAV